MFQIMDLANWNRKRTFEMYRNFDDPFFGLIFNVDVTKMVSHSKKSGESFFLNSLHSCIYTANQIESFRYRLVNDEVRIYDIIHPGSTIFLPDETFGFCYFQYFVDREQFLIEGKKTLDQNLENPSSDPKFDVIDLIHFSVIPWISFTGFKHASHQRNMDSVPKIVLGKYFQQGDSIMMPVSVEVNHAMMDGYHVGLFEKELQLKLNDI